MKGADRNLIVRARSHLRDLKAESLPREQVEASEMNPVKVNTGAFRDRELSNG